jgi:hypothetical protein
MKELEPFMPLLAKTKRPDLKFTHHFKGFGIHKSEVDVEIWKEHGKALILFTDTNKGTSITNAAEQVITEVYREHLHAFDVEDCLFCETYNKHKEGIDIILPEWDVDYYGKKTCRDVEWRHVGKVI